MQSDPKVGLCFQVLGKTIPVDHGFALHGAVSDVLPDFHEDQAVGLSLGESRDLVNDILWFPKWPQVKGYWLVRDPEGDLPLPVWVDHVGSKGTVWRQFRMEKGILETPPENDDRWITIEKTGEKR